MRAACDFSADGFRARKNSQSDFADFTGAPQISRETFSLCGDVTHEKNKIEKTAQKYTQAKALMSSFLLCSFLRKILVMTFFKTKFFIKKISAFFTNIQDFTLKN